MSGYFIGQSRRDTSEKTKVSRQKADVHKKIRAIEARIDSLSSNEWSESDITVLDEMIMDVEKEIRMVGDFEWETIMAMRLENDHDRLASRVAVLNFK